jgi:hypothetical protein
LRSLYFFHNSHLEHCKLTGALPDLTGMSALSFVTLFALLKSLHLQKKMKKSEFLLNADCVMFLPACHCTPDVFTSHVDRVALEFLNMKYSNIC